MTGKEDEVFHVIEYPLEGLTTSIIEAIRELQVIILGNGICWSHGRLYSLRRQKNPPNLGNIHGILGLMAPLYTRPP